MRRSKRLIGAGLSLSLAAAAAVAISSQQQMPGNEWRYFGGDKGYTRYSALDQINRDNVKNLRDRVAAPGGQRQAHAGLSRPARQRLPESRRRS